MTRPQIVRADTLDLQDHDQPSAQSHAQPPPLTNGAAPHQTAELRHVQQERNSETDFLADQWGSGRSSHEGSELLDEDPDFLLDNGPDPHDHRHAHAAAQQEGQRHDADDDADPDQGVDDDDDGVDKISSSPSIEDEDINFEFVYALHTFVATVEGQANATKGDTMVLLDDSNSYWWLVRVVKDSSIGYLPAEHIETPTERLARLNKHRNIDLAQSMLGDNPERSKNPLKKAMRRRNAKIVQFTAPTYFEPPENDWSDEEADDDSGDIGMAEHQDTASSEDDKPDANGADADQADEGQATAQTQKTLNQPEAGDVGQESRASGDQESVGEESTERRTRNGTIRNTDSFFKDDTVEPRKISLTPNLLREENGTRTSDSKDSAASTSQENIFDTLDRSDSTSSDKSRDGKNKKDKKPGMLSGLFKRKDKKIKVDEAVGGVVTKQGAADVPLSPSAIVTSEPLSPTLASPTSPVAPTVASLKKGPNKLAKAPPSSAASSNSATAPALAKSSSVTSLRGARDDRKTADGSVAAAASTGVSGDTRQPLNLQIPTGDGEQKPSSGLLSPLTNLVNSDQPKKEKLKKAKTRMELDVDSSPEAEEAKDNPFNDTAHIPQAGPSPGRPPPTAPFTADLSEKDVDGVDYRGPSHDTGGEEQASILAADVQPRMTHSASSGESDPDAPHTPIMHQTRATFEGGSSLTTGTPGGSVSMSSPAASTPATTANSEGRDSWDGAALRTYLDGSSTNDVKDMLVIINDHTGVVPVGHDHPVMVELGLQEQQRKLDALSAQLDGLLQGFLEKRRATRAAAAAATTSSTATAAS